MLISALLLAVVFSKAVTNPSLAALVRGWSRFMAATLEKPGIFPWEAG